MLNLEGLAEFLTIGFTLNGKTMIKELSIPSISMPGIERNMNATIEDVYVALKESTEMLIQPDTGLALSGGLDSRVVAGIAAELEEIPTFTFGVSNFEKRIAHKIASTLKLPHHVINIDMRLNKETIEKLRNLVMETGGAMDVFNLYIKTSLSQHHKEHGIKTTISAYGFDEVNCSTFAYKINSTQKFCDVFAQAFAHSSLPYEYREIAKRNLSECCKNISFSTLYPLIWIKNVLKDFEVKDWVRDRTPMIDRKVLSTITSLPYEQRIHKRVQKAILRKYFPKLYKIPYSMSGLPPFLHYSTHVYTYRTIQVLFRSRASAPRPLLTFDCPWFLRINLPLFQKLLFSNVPPFMDIKTVQTLVYRLQTRGNDRDAGFLNKLLTYALLASQINS